MKNFVKISVLAIYLVAVLPVLAFAQVAGTQPARMLFDPSSGSVVANPNFTVNVKVDIGTGAQSAGADAVVKFDTAKLTFVSAEKVTEGNPTTFYGNNGLFTATPPATANTSGTIEIGRTADAGSYASGVGVLAKLTFTPKVAVGQTVSLDFVFTPGSTTDSNVAGNVGGVDLLGSVTNATLTIAQGTPAAVLDHVDIAPTSATVLVNGTKSFTATAKDASGNAIASGVAYSWGITGSGTLSTTTGATVIYTAGATAGTAVITVTATQGAVVKTASATIIINTANLPSNGPEMFSWIGVAMSAFGMSGLSYLKLFAPKQTVENESDHLAN